MRVCGALTLAAGDRVGIAETRPFADRPGRARVSPPCGACSSTSGQADDAALEFFGGVVEAAYGAGEGVHVVLDRARGFGAVGDAGGVELTDGGVELVGDGGQAGPGFVEGV